MKVFIERENKHLELDAKTGLELLNKLEINPEEVILIRNNEVMLSEEEINSDDEIKVLSVVSGG